MTMRRVVASACVVVAAVVAVPSMLLAGFNSADAIVIAAPFALVAVWLRPQRSTTPAGGVASPAASDLPPVAAPPAGSPSTPFDWDALHGYSHADRLARITAPGVDR